MKSPHSKWILLIVTIISYSLLRVGEGGAERSPDPPISWSTCGYSQMTVFLHQLVAKHSNIARLYSIGKSVEGRDLWVVVMSDHPLERPLLRPQIKYVGNVIGNYGPSCYLLLKLIKELVILFDQEDSLERRLLEMNEVHILPNINPDGFIRSIPGACSGAHGRYNAAGFDLNRDFPDPFNRKEGKSEQPETQAVMSWIQRNKFVLSVSLMSGALVVAYPYDSIPIDSSITSHPTPDDDMFRHLAMTYVHNVKSSSTERRGDEENGRYCPAIQRTFRDGIVNGAEWGPASGTMLDFNYAEGVFEIMVGVSCCRNENNQLALDQIWETNKEAMVRMGRETEYGIRGQVIDSETHLPLPNVSISKHSQHSLVDENNKTPMTWTTTINGEFWRLALPGNYILQVCHEGYEVSRVPVQVKPNHFTRIIVELKIKRKSDPPGSLDFESSGIDSLSLNTTTHVNISEGTSRIQPSPSYSKYNSGITSPLSPPAQNILVILIATFLIR